MSGGKIECQNVIEAFKPDFISFKNETAIFELLAFFLFLPE